MTSFKIIADSINPDGQRITTGIALAQHQPSLAAAVTAKNNPAAA